MNTKTLDIFFLIVNAILWCLVSRYYVRRYGFNNTGVLFILFYTISAAIAIHLYITAKDQLFSWNGLSIFPLIYLCIFIVLFAKLIINKDNQAVLIKPPENFLMFLYLFTIVFSLVDILSVIKGFNEGLLLLAVDSDYGNSLYEETTDKYVYTARVASGVINFVGVLSNAAKGIAPALLLYYLTNKRINRLVLVGLILSTLTTYMHAISLGTRSVIIQALLSTFMLYFYLSKYYSDKIKSLIKPVFIVCAGVVVFGSTLITFSRATAKDRDVISFIESYAAQSFLYFGCYGFDNGDEIRYGDRTFPLIKSIFFDDVARSSYERRNKYVKMDINESVFVTFVGDFVFDFGVFGGAFLMIILYRLFLFFLKGNVKKLYFDQVLIIYLVSYILSGFYLYPLADYAGNVLFILIICVSIVFKIQRIYSNVY